MKKIPLLLIIFALLFNTVNLWAAQHMDIDASRIVVEVELPKGFDTSSVHINYAPYDFVVRASWKKAKPEITGNLVKWTLAGNRPLMVDLTFILGQGNMLNLYEPGDSVRINLKKSIPTFSGKNADKFMMVQEFDTRAVFLKMPKNVSFSKVNSFEDYFEWNNYLNERQRLLQMIFESYKSRVTPFAYEHLMANRIEYMEYMRISKFGGLVKLVDGSPQGNIEVKKLAAIFDTTINNKYAKWLQQSNTGRLTGNGYYYYDFVRKSTRKEYDFDMKHDSLHISGSRKLAYVKLANKIYKKHALQMFYMYTLTETDDSKINTPEIKIIMEDYYARPGNPEYKQYVTDRLKIWNEYVKERTERWVSTGRYKMPDFLLPDQFGNNLSNRQLYGKVVLLNFFKAGSRNCDEMNTVLNTVRSNFKGDTNVVFLFISKDRYVKASNALASSPGITYLITDVQENGQSIFKDYNISTFPQVMLLDASGKIRYNSALDTGYRADVIHSATDYEQRLTGRINKELAVLNDGPYIIHARDSVFYYSVRNMSVTKRELPINGGIQLKVQTDDYYKTFPIKLKKSLQTEPSLYVRPEKLVVLSDIEGSFDTFRKLLQANKVIDNQFNWTFSNGHLVFSGDMFDRGRQVTECLWLVYMLEEKAKSAGGYVHFVLGNHEIMNLQGDHRYVDKKYKDNAVSIGKTLVQLYNEDSELGRWLRTKNVIEKIDDLLFVHGGISAEMGRLKLSVEEINKAARPNYANRQDDYKNASTNTIMSSTYGPFWYRGYYDTKSKASEKDVDGILQAFDVKHIVTGHTIVADTISIHYKGKVINTDTPHAKGTSEALLIEGNNFYRVNAEGKRVLLFREEDK